MSINTDHHLQVVAEKPVSDYAPRRKGEPYLTDAMIAPEGKPGDPIRLAQMAGPVIDEIGRSTADKIELSALAIVENARRGAETILAEAHVQATDMTSSAETMADEMRAFAKNIRAYTDRKARQVGEFCNVAQSILGTMYSLGDQFQHMTTQEVVAEKDEPIVQIPTFLTRSKAK